MNTSSRPMGHAEGTRVSALWRRGDTPSGIRDRRALDVVPLRALRSFETGREAAGSRGFLPTSGARGAEGHGQCPRTGASTVGRVRSGGSKERSCSRAGVPRLAASRSSPRRGVRSMS